MLTRENSKNYEPSCRNHYLCVHAKEAVQMVNVLNRITSRQLHDLVNYRRRIKDIAKELGVTANYLGKMVKERAPKRNQRSLRKVRNLFQLQIAREVLEGKHTIKEGASIACVSERTMFRRLAKVRADYIKSIGKD